MQLQLLAYKALVVALGQMDGPSMVPIPAMLLAPEYVEPKQRKPMHRLVTAAWLPGFPPVTAWLTIELAMSVIAWIEMLHQLAPQMALRSESRYPCLL
jgi:hypothetical protein